MYCSTEPSPEKEVEKKRPVESEVQPEEAPAPFEPTADVTEEVSLVRKKVEAVTEEGK